MFEQSPQQDVGSRISVQARVLRVQARGLHVPSSEIWTEMGFSFPVTPPELWEQPMCCPEPFSTPCLPLLVGRRRLQAGQEPKFLP